MRGPFIVGDLVYVKLDVCRVSLLGEILEIGDQGKCKLRMCGYSPHSMRIPMYATALTANLEPSQDVIKRWQSNEDVIVENNMRADIDKLAKELEAHLGTKEINVRLY